MNDYFTNLSASKSRVLPAYPYDHGSAQFLNKNN